MSEQAEQLRRRIEAIEDAAGRNRTNAENYRRMTEELGEITGTASAPDGVVTVVAAADGSVSEVTFGERMRRMSPSELSPVVVHTIARARAEAARAQAEVVRRHLGDTGMLDEALRADERVFGDRPAVDPEAAPA
ncbi:YbaB/EbfC family nucleoid-associated protein, partial [Saccharomonospora saliphila]|uniref:YbaB/EbfC family nucleoid-associated protein n=1 Tax=Saccharomonospora saliphila TaxID=369829 RepID=UPI00037212B2